MFKRFTKVVGTFAMLGTLAACASGPEANWYEQRCERMNFVKGTADFKQCIARDKKWVEDTQIRAAKQNHP